jgi:hypothetical protein
VVIYRACKGFAFQHGQDADQGSDGLGPPMEGAERA